VPRRAGCPLLGCALGPVVEWRSEFKEISTRARFLSERTGDSANGAKARTRGAALTYGLAHGGAEAAAAHPAAKP